jgi:hypothetical protein
MAHVESMLRQGPSAARHAARGASQSSLVRRLARLGFAARGVLHVTVGALALLTAFGLGGDLTNNKGALEHLAGQPFGGLLLALVGTGLAGYALWQFVRAGAGEPGVTAVKRAGFALSGAAHVGLAVAAFHTLAGAGDSGRDQQREWTARLLAEPFGAVAVGAIGVGVIGLGIHQLYQAATAKFREQFESYEMSGRERHAATVAGRVGYAARGVVFGLMGAFLIKAATEADPDQVRGLDGALRELAQSGPGPFVLAIVATGLVAFGAFCLMLARYARLPRG